MNQSVLDAAVLIGRSVLATVLVLAGAAKLADTDGFAATLIGIGVAPRRRALVRALGVVVPLLEAGLGLALVSGLWAELINVAVLALMGVFNVVVLLALHRRIPVACRCFGVLSDSLFSGRGLVRSAVLTALAAAVVWYEAIRHLQVSAPVSTLVLLVCGYGLFGVVVAQAARTIAVLQKRRQA